MSGPWEDFQQEDGPWADFQTETPKTGKTKQAAKNFVGGLDGAAAIAAGLPSYIYSGLKGLGTLATTGDINRAGNAVTQEQERNFGLGQYKPRTQEGQQFTEMIGEGMQKGVKGVGQAYYDATGSELGRTNAEIATETVLNFLPLPGGKAVRALGKKLERKPEPLQSKIEPEFKAVEKGPWEDFQKMEQQELPLDNNPQQIREMQTRGQPQRDLFEPVNAGREAMPVESTLPNELKTSIEKTQHLNRDGQQMGIVEDFGNNDPMARMPEMRVDENGMPIRADLSMELANLENPLQKNLWGDELGPALGQERSLTEAMDQMPPWERNSDYVGRELEASPELNAAVDEANLSNGMGRSQRGGVDVSEIINAVRDLFPSRQLYGKQVLMAPKPDTVDTPRTDATIQMRQEKIAKMAVMPEPLRKNFADFDSPQTIEEAYWRGEQAGDIKDGLLQTVRDNLTSGIRYKAVMTKHPVLQYFNKEFTNARAKASQFSREYVTGKDGVATLGQHLNPNEMQRAMATLLEGDKLQHQWTASELADRGLSSKQIKFVEAYYKADKALLDAENAARAKVGLEPIRQREGHFPGIFTGSYKTLAMKDGKVVGVIATDTLVAQRRAQDWLKKNVEGVTFEGNKRHPLYSNTKYGSRQGLGGNYNRSDMFSGMNDLVAMLAEHDPKFAEVQKALQEYIKQDANSLYGFNRHELEKKGVYGSEGNKPWEGAGQNSKEAFKSMLQYFEEGAGHFNAQSALNEARTAIKDYSTSQPNMSHFLDSYVDHITGGYNSGMIGKAINLALDAPGAALGIGSRIPVKALRSVKNAMSQIYMGWGNYAFTLAQYAQLGQSAAPFLALTANRLGINPIQASKSAGRAMVDFMALIAEEKAGGKFKSDADASSRAMFKYAEDRGMLNFSEMEKAQEATKNKVLRAKDAVAEANMKLGEAGTRAPAFMSIARAMVDAGHPADARTFFIAENISQLGMIDYHPWERPRIYGKLGAIGPFAGGLATFKHGYLSQQAVLAQRGRGNGWTPMAASIASMAALSGIMGVPFYDELDFLVKKLTNHFGGKEESIKDLALKNVPDTFTRGAASAQSGMDWQGKFSSANMIPDTAMGAVSPHLEGALKIANSIFDMADNGADEQSIRNFVMAAAPNGPIKGMLESVVSKGPNGEVMGKDGLPGYPRTEDEWTIRQSTGLISTEERKAKDQRWENQSSRRADLTRMKAIKADVYRRVVNGTLTPEEGNELYEEYKQRGGNPVDLVNEVQKAKKDQALSQKNRDRGIPNSSINSIKRFKDFEEE